MNITTNYFTPNFEARIKLKAPNTKALLQSAIGTAAMGVATTSGAEFALSGIALGDSNNSALGDANYNLYNEIMQLGETPKELLISHKNMLTSADGRYDAAGYVEGIPTQSTALPISAMTGAFLGTAAGSNATNLASGDNIDALSNPLSASTVSSLNSSKELASNKKVQLGLGGSSLASTMAGSLYSGFVDPKTVDLPKSIEQNQLVCAVSGLGTAAFPLGAGLVKSSNTKSSQFIADTLVGKDSNKSIPS